jgi:tRNA (adenine57-N1/adenine58-N1)-methyltransferase catalytic subunit
VGGAGGPPPPAGGGPPRPARRGGAAGGGGPGGGAPAPRGRGGAVLLVDRKGRRYLINLEEGGSFHYHGGVVPHADLIGKPEGTTVRSAQGANLLAVRPTAVDWTLKAPRGAQVVYPKDQAMILTLGDIGPGATVVEAGAGSGALTAAPRRAGGPAGRVTSFEGRDEHADVAERNIAQRFGDIPQNWELRREDVVAGLEGLSSDRVVLDLLEPWAAVKVAAEALRPGGIFVAYTPTVPQVMRLREGLDHDGSWGLVQTVETLLRGWHIDGLAVRPDHRMVAHTAFITTARRLA